jgi:hypothetical protein
MTSSPKFYFYAVTLIAAVQAILQVSLAQAYENDSPQGRQNYDQNYLDRLHFKTPGQDFLTTVDILPDVIDHSTTTSNGVQTSQSMRDRFLLTAGETYGITDLLSFNITESYLFRSVAATTNDITGVRTSPATSGLSDPSFNLNYRYLGGLVGSTFGDGFVTFSPSAGDNQGASTSQDGNNLRGDTSLQVGTDLYQVVSNNEFSLGGSWFYNTSKNIDSANPGNNEVGDNYSNFDVRLRYRLHFNEFVFIQAQGTFYMPYSTNETYYNSNNGRTVADSYPFYAVPRVTFGFLPTNSTLLTAGVYYTNYTRNYTNSSNTTSSSNSTVYHEVTLDFGLSFLL